jgi:hypothetical protein
MNEMRIGKTRKPAPDGYHFIVGVREDKQCARHARLVSGGSGGPVEKALQLPGATTRPETSAAHSHWLFRMRHFVAAGCTRVRKSHFVLARQNECSKGYSSREKFQRRSLACVPHYQRQTISLSV